MFILKLYEDGKSLDDYNQFTLIGLFGSIPLMHELFLLLSTTKERPSKTICKVETNKKDMKALMESYFHAVPN